MNRKLINGLLVATLAIGGTVSVTSCKDTDEDLYAQLRDENVTLDDQVKALQQAQALLKAAQEKCKQDCEQAWTDFKATGFKECLDEYAKKYAAHQTLDWYLNQINDALTDPQGKKYASLSDRFNNIETAISLLENTNITTIPGIDQVAGILEGKGKTLPEVLQEALDANAQATENQKILEALLEGYTYTGEDVTQIKGLLKKAVNDAAEANRIVGELQTKITDEIEPAVKANTKAIKELTNKLNAMTDRLNKLVTSIELQQVVNPVFGKLNLPLDVNSKMLIAYYGDASNVNFPPVGSSATEYDSKSIVITDADKSRLNITTTPFNGLLYDGKDGNVDLGSVYLSINPANLDMSGTVLDLVNSKGVPSPVALSPLAVSDEELMFGFGRADEIPNGFYKTDATIAADKLDEVKLTFDDNFKDNIETMLEGRSLRDIADVAKLLAKQFNNKVSASGLRADWKYDEYAFDAEGNIDLANSKKVTDATYSEFGIAATAFKPLSYKFLYGKHFKPLGTISPIEDFTINSKLNITMPTFTFNFDNVNLGFSFGDITVEIPDGTEIKVTIPATKVYEVVNGVTTNNVIGEIKETTATATDFTSLENALSTAISNALKTQNEAVNSAFKNAIKEVANQINSQINTKMNELKTNIESQFDTIIKEIQDNVNGYLGTVNNYIDKVNGFLNRINRLLEDPNHYLQVTMLYTADDNNFHQVSNSETLPTGLVLNGGDAIKLIATSYTGDMIVPSFRKYVAVTNVYNTRTKVTDTALLAEANSAKFMNEVIPGTQNEVALKLKAGYTYEIVYSSLDYHGVTSTRKFYISAE